jgi:transcriptional regulator with XRE-family HTH domain
MLERKLKMIPIKELARQTGVDRNAIRRVLRGERVHSKTRTKLLKAVAKFSKG